MPSFSIVNFLPSSADSAVSSLRAWSRSAHTGRVGTGNFSKITCMRVNRYFIQMKSWVYYILIRNRNRPSQLCAKTVHFCACRLFFQSNFFCAKFGVDSEWNRDSYVESESTPKMLESPKLFMRRVRRRRRVEKSKDFLLGYLKNELFMIFTDTRVPDCL